MAPRLAAEMSSLSHCNDFRRVPLAEAGVEDVLLVVGEIVGFDQIYSTSRVNKAKVVFLREERLVNELVESEIWEYMFLNNPNRPLEASFRVFHGESSYVVYASTDSLRCFEIGFIGHKWLTCPLKEWGKVPENQTFDEAGPNRADDADSGEGTSAVAALEVTRGKELSERLVETVSVSEDVELQAGQGENEAGEEVRVEAGLGAEGSSVTELESVAVGESQSGSVMSVEEGMDEEEERLSEVSDIGSSQFRGESLYTVERFNS
ncbi:hypothetical protein AOLI_G00011290 [Acnodon oligacanthus]